MSKAMKETNEERKIELWDNFKRSTGNLLVKMQRMLHNNGGEFMVGTRVSVITLQ